jgi:hypothetical protein
MRRGVLAEDGQLAGRGLGAERRGACTQVDDQGSRATPADDANFLDCDVGGWW